LAIKNSNCQHDRILTVVIVD